MTPLIHSRSAKYSLMITIIGFAAFATCSKDEIKSGRGRGQDNVISLTVPSPAGIGLLDGSGDLNKATQPIIDMTSCSGNETSLIPARTIRLTMEQLFNAMTFYSKVSLNKNDFIESSNSTTNFAENSYALHGNENFTRFVDLQADKIAKAFNFSQVLSCDPAQDANCRSILIQTYASRVLNTDDSATLNAIDKVYGDLSAEGSEAAARSVVRLLFQHPLFLYRMEIGQGSEGELSSFELAQMLSYTLTNNPPDAELWELAKNKQLNKSTMPAQIDRILAVPETLRSLEKRFFKPYLGIQDAGNIPVGLSLDQVQGLEDSFFTFLSSTPVGNIFSSVSDASDNRLGVHTHKLYIASHTNDNGQISPIHAGIALRNDLLCQTFAPPPTIPPQEGDAEAGINMRRSAPACNNCHQYIDPVGQNYLAFNGQGAPSGSSANRESEIAATIDFDDKYPSMEALTQSMGGSEHIKRCMALQVYRFTMARPEQEGESCHINSIYNSLNQNQVSFKDLVKNALIYAGNAKRR